MGCMQSTYSKRHTSNYNSDMKPRVRANLYQEGNRQQTDMKIGEGISNEWNRSQLKDLTTERETNHEDKNTLEVIKEFGI